MNRYIGQNLKYCYYKYTFTTFIIGVIIGIGKEIKLKNTNKY